MRSAYELSAILAVDCSMKGDPSLGLRSKRGDVCYPMDTRRREGSGVGRGLNLNPELHLVNRTSATKSG